MVKTKPNDDPYRARVLLQADPIVRDVQLEMLWAARQVLAARDGLEGALRRLERHPDYVMTQRAWRQRVCRRGAWGDDLHSLTLAWWVHEGIKSILEDATLSESVTVFGT